MSERPLQRFRRRWLAARRMVGLANALSDHAAMAFAMRVLNRVRAEYQAAIRACAGHIAYLRLLKGRRQTV